MHRPSFAEEQSGYRGHVAGLAERRMMNESTSPRVGLNPEFVSVPFHLKLEQLRLKHAVHESLTVLRYEITARMYSSRCW